MQNDYVERFNRTFREDVLDVYVFEILMKRVLLLDLKSEDIHNSLYSSTV